MAQTIGFTDRPRISEVLKWELEPRFCRDAKVIKNTNAAALVAGDLIPGTLLVNNSGTWEIAQTGQSASVAGIFLGNDSSSIPEALAAGASTAQKHQILVRGPALINKDMLVLTNKDGESLVEATVLTALAALDIRPLAEPTSSATSTQTT